MTLACIVSAGATEYGQKADYAIRCKRFWPLTFRSSLNIMPRKPELNQIIKSIQLDEI